MEAEKPSAASNTTGESDGAAAAASAAKAAAATDGKSADSSSGAPSEDFLIFGARPSHLFDDIAIAIDSLLTAEVSTLPLLPRTLADDPQQEQQRQEGGSKDKPMTGEEKLIAALRRAYKKNIDLAEAYCSRNVFTVQNYSKTKRRKILETYLGEEEEGGAKKGDGEANTAPPAPLPASTFAAPEGELPTPEQLTGVDEEILVARQRLQQEKRRRIQLRRQLDRLTKASQTLMGVQEALKKGAGGDDGEGKGPAMERLQESVQSAVEGHKELTLWNARAEEVLELLDKIKGEREEGEIEGKAAGGNGSKVVGREEDEKQRKRMLEEVGGGAGTHGTKEQVASLLKKIRGD